MREFMRRLILLIGICTAIGMAMYASLKPCVLVEWVKTRENVPVINVSGEEWKALYQTVNEMRESRASHPEWNKRLDKSELKYRTIPVESFWFDATEQPIASIVDQLINTPKKRANLSLSGSGADTNLEVSYHTYSKDNWRAFLGFYHGQQPPSSYLYPLRSFWFVPLILGLLIYIFLPRVKIGAHDLAIPRGKMIATDIVSLILLFCPFFLLPFLLGGPIQAFANWWGIAAVCWPLALLGLFAFSVAAWYGGLRLTPDKKHMIIHSWSLNETIDYSTIDRVDPAVLKPPRWLKILLWAASLMGQGKSSMGTAGQALILEGSAYSGWSFHLKDGRNFDFWYTNQMGSPMFKNLDVLKKSLEDAHVTIGSKRVEKKGLGFGISLQGKGKRRGTYALLIFLGTPLVITALFALI